MKRLLIALFALSIVMGAKAQSFVAKTNLAGWAAQTANVGFGLVFNEYSTLDFNIYKTMGESWVRDVDMYGVQIEYRFWLSQQPLEDFFVGVSVMPMKFDNITINTEYNLQRRKEGSLLLGSLNFGYCWMLTPRWSLDLEYGVGGAYIYYQDLSLPDKNGNSYYREHETFRFIPTNLGVNLSYILK